MNQQHRRNGVEYSEVPVIISNEIFGVNGSVGTFRTFELMKEVNGVQIPYGLPIRLPAGQMVSKASLHENELELNIGGRKTTYTLHEGLWHEKRN